MATSTPAGSPLAALSHFLECWLLPWPQPGVTERIRMVRCHSSSGFLASDQMLAFAAMWFGGALASLMGIAALGSIQISLSERPAVCRFRINPARVVRRERSNVSVVKPGHERDVLDQLAIEIAGFNRSPDRAKATIVLLDGCESTPRMIASPAASRAIADCIAALKAMSIPNAMPATRCRTMGTAGRKFDGCLKWFYLFLACAIGNFYFNNRIHGLAHHGSGLVFAALILLGLIFRRSATASSVAKANGQTGSVQYRRSTALHTVRNRLPDKEG